MDLTWSRLEPQSSPEGQARVEDAPGVSWLLLVGEDENVLEASALDWIARRAPELPLIAPPDAPPLPIALHHLPPPGIHGARVLFAPGLDGAFFDTGFSPTSPLYLIPRLVQLASEGAPLTFVATARTSGFAERGIATRFAIRRVSADRHDGTPAAASDLPGWLPRWQRDLAIGLSAAEPDRARAYQSAAAQAEGEALPHMFRACSLLSRGRRDEGILELRRAIELDPEIAAAHYELGKALIQNDDLEGAVAAFRRTVELLPEFPSAWGNLGAALGELQDLEGASDALRRAVALDPRNAALRSNLGVAYRDCGRLSDAESELLKCLELDPSFVFGHYNLAHVLYLAGRHAEAIERFERAQSMDRSRSPRQALLLAAARLASGDFRGASRDYREIFGRLTGPMKTDMRTVAEWDLKQLAQRSGVTPELQQAAGLLRSLA